MIEHYATKVKRPQSSGIVESLHCTLLDEHLRVEGRRNRFETIEDIQRVLGGYLAVYNHKRQRQRRDIYGCTPAL